MGCHLVYQMDGAIAVLYCKKKKKMCLCVLTPHHLPMEIIHVVDHTHTECDDNSLIFMLSFFVFVDHIKKEFLINMFLFLIYEMIFIFLDK